ncbi:MAG: hypothetical protein ACLRJV_13185 [Eubacteriales bacterium]
MKYVTEQSNSFTDRKIKLECPTELLMLKTGVFCCLLDDVLTFCWGNSSFFTTIGHSEESFCSRFHDLRQYYAKFPNEFAAIRQELEQALEEGCSDFEMTIRLPLPNGGFSWARLYGTIRKIR